MEGAGAKVERVLELAAISTNNNTVPGDKNALNPSGLRLGTPALTSRQMGEEEMKRMAGFIDEAVKISSIVCQRLRELGWQEGHCESVQRVCGQRRGDQEDDIRVTRESGAVC